MLSTLVLNLSSKPLALDCENSEESPCEQGEYVDDIEYDAPDLSEGIKGIDYGIVYGLGDEEMEMEAEAQTRIISRGAERQCTYLK